MKQSHRKMLSELQHICNQLGSALDYTSTHESKLKDRQGAHMLVSHVLYGILVDHPENEFRTEDMEKAVVSLKQLEELRKKTYPDRNGYLKPCELTPNTINTKP